MHALSVRKKEFSLVGMSRFLVEDEVAPELIRITIDDADTIENVENLSFYLQYKNKLGQYGVEILSSTYANGVVTIDWFPSKEFTKESGSMEIQLFGISSEFAETVDTVFEKVTNYYLKENDSYNYIEVHDEGSQDSPKVGDSIADYEREHGTVYENRIVTRWSTLKANITLPENIQGESFDYIDSDYIESLLLQMQQLVIDYERKRVVINELVERAEQASATSVGASGDALLYRNSAKQHMDFAKEYSLDAQSALRDTIALKEYLEKYTTKAFRATIGDGRRTYTVTHNLGTQNLIAQLWAVNGVLPFYTIAKISDDTVQIDFEEAVSDNSVDIVISAIDYSEIESVRFENITNVSFATREEMLAILNGEQQENQNG